MAWPSVPPCWVFLGCFWGHGGCGINRWRPPKLSSRWRPEPAQPEREEGGRVRCVVVAPDSSVIAGGLSVFYHNLSSTHARRRADSV